MWRASPFLIPDISPNYVEFANQAGQYDEVAKFLRSREAKRMKELQDE